MTQPHRPVMTHRRLVLFKWLMVFIPPVTVAVGHSLRAVSHSPQQAGGGLGETLLVTLLVTSLALVLSYMFVETLFRVLRRLQAEAVARQQELLTMSAVMKERERLSRELHDGVAQLVADLLLRIDTIKELVEANRPGEAEAELERLHGVANEIYEDIGDSIAGLRTNVTERGLGRALQDYVDQFEERHQIPASLRILTGQAPDSDDHAQSATPSEAEALSLSKGKNPSLYELVGPISPLAALQIFRLVQEALTNVRKHAVAREATVTLMSDGPDQLTVVIADDGRGFTPDDQSNGKARPLGLTSMRERVEALGGTFRVSTRPGSGTQVMATIPIPHTRSEDEHAARATAAG